MTGSALCGGQSAKQNQKRPENKSVSCAAMNNICWQLLSTTFAVSVIIRCVTAFPKTMQFELPDKDEMCFYHEFDGAEKYVLEFRVVRGGNNDVDVRVRSPNGKDILFEKRQHVGKHVIEVQLHLLCIYAI